MRFCKKRMLVCIFLIVFMGLFNNVDAESAYGSPIKKEQYEKLICGLFWQICAHPESPGFIICLIL